MRFRLSVVIIGRNEERAIARCIEAARQAADEAGEFEILFVDSASTDRTVAIVESMGVRVIPLDGSKKLSPSAGRYVGSRHASGEYVVFVDADTLLYDGFLGQAMRRLDEDRELAGVNGWIDDLDENGEIVPNAEIRFGVPASVEWLRGPCCLYRREALMSVGSFNPYLAVEEEAELGLRLIGAGLRLELIPVPMGCHTRFYHHRTLASVVMAFRRDIRTGRVGEIVRTTAYASRSGNGLKFLWTRLNTTLAFAAWLLVGAACAIMPGTLYISLFAAASAVGFLLLLAKKRSLRQSAVFIPAKFFCLLDMVAGLNKLALKDPEDYLD